jgi:hypothetical protein
MVTLTKHMALPKISVTTSGMCEVDTPPWGPQLKQKCLLVVNYPTVLASSSVPRYEGVWGNEGITPSLLISAVGEGE